MSAFIRRRLSVLCLMPVKHHMLATMLEDAPPLAGISEALRASAVCFAIDEANRTGQVVDLKPYWNQVGEVIN